jgi:transposase-like protein
MGGRRRRWSAERWREVLETQGRSGLSLKAFADRRGIPYSTLISWRRKLAETAVPARLVPVEVADAPGKSVEVQVGPGMVRVEPGFDEGHLVRVLRALRAC